MQTEGQRLAKVRGFLSRGEGSKRREGAPTTAAASERETATATTAVAAGA